MFPAMFQFISRNSTHMKVKNWIYLETKFEVSIEILFESQIAFKIEYLDLFLWQGSSSPRVLG
jgi:hypothetical protein